MFMRLGGLRIYVFFLLLSLPFVLLCSSAKGKEIRPSSVIRYVNLKAVYEHVLVNDKEIIEMQNKQQELINKKNKLNSSSGEADNEAKSDDDELSLLEIDEDAVKLRVYKKISSALRDIARKRGIDLILNIGDSLVYSKKEFDITEDLIGELDHRNDKVSPEWK